MARSFIHSGTSPPTMRCASPSTMAVLPTPGSPIRTGLFLVLRERMRITRRISASRPMTGSSLPARASATTSTPYFSRASYRASGSSEVTRWLPRTAARACRKRSRVTPAAAKARAAPLPPPSPIRARARCSTETNSSFSRAASASAAARASERPRAMCGSVPPPETRGALSSSVRCRERSSCGSAPRRSRTRGTTPSGSCRRAAARCGRSTSGWPRRRAMLRASWRASWDLRVSLLAFMASSHRVVWWVHSPAGPPAAKGVPQAGICLIGRSPPGRRARMCRLGTFRVMMSCGSTAGIAGAAGSARSGAGQ